VYASEGHTEEIPYPDLDRQQAIFPINPFTELLSKLYKSAKSDLSTKW